MTNSMYGRSLELYFIDGQPDGMLTAEVFNWTGHVLMTPRTRLAEALRRSETERTGVYILVGARDGIDVVYVGEAEELRKRLRDHAAAKDWWTSAILVSTAGDSLHKAHVKYLEARLVETAKAAGSVQLDNANTPPRPSLGEAHVANMEAFLETLLMVLPALRFDMFLDKKRSIDAVAPAPSPREQTYFELKSKRIGFDATAILDGSEFIVTAGSIARSGWIGSEKYDHSYQRLHSDLVREGILSVKGKLAEFTQSYAFSSLSAAAAVVTGRAASGPVEWRVKGSSKTYKDWEVEQIAKEVKS